MEDHKLKDIGSLPNRQKLKSGKSQNMRNHNHIELYHRKSQGLKINMLHLRETVRLVLLQSRM